MQVSQDSQTSIVVAKLRTAGKWELVPSLLSSRIVRESACCAERAKTVFCVAVFTSLGNPFSRFQLHFCMICHETFQIGWEVRRSCYRCSCIRCCSGILIDGCTVWAWEVQQGNLELKGQSGKRYRRIKALYETAYMCQSIWFKHCQCSGVICRGFPSLEVTTLSTIFVGLALGISLTDFTGNPRQRKSTLRIPVLLVVVYSMMMPAPWNLQCIALLLPEGCLGIDNQLS